MVLQHAVTMAGRCTARRVLGVPHNQLDPPWCRAWRGWTGCFVCLDQEGWGRSPYESYWFWCCTALWFKKSKEAFPLCQSPHPVDSIWRTGSHHKPSPITPNCFFHCLTNGDANAYFNFIFFPLEWRIPKAKDVKVTVNWLLVDLSPGCPSRRNTSCVGYRTNAAWAERNSPGITVSRLYSSCQEIHKYNCFLPELNP